LKRAIGIAGAISVALFIGLATILPETSDIRARNAVLVLVGALIGLPSVLATRQKLFDSSKKAHPALWALAFIVPVALFKILPSVVLPLLLGFISGALITAAWISPKLRS